MGTIRIVNNIVESRLWALSECGDYRNVGTISNYECGHYRIKSTRADQVKLGQVREFCGLLGPSWHWGALTQDFRIESARAVFAGPLMQFSYFRRVGTIAWARWILQSGTQTGMQKGLRLVAQ